MDSCMVERSLKRQRGALDVATGKLKYVEAEIVIELCGTPLFMEVERETGVCRTCASGWTHPDNSPTSLGRDTIRAAGGTVPEVVA